MTGINMNVVQSNEFMVKDIASFTQFMKKQSGMTVKEKKGRVAIVAYGGHTEVTTEFLEGLTKYVASGETVAIMDVKYKEGKIESSHYTITSKGYKKTDNTKDAKAVGKGVLQKMPWAKRVVKDD